MTHGSITADPSISHEMSLGDFSSALVTASVPLPSQEQYPVTPETKVATADVSAKVTEAHSSAPATSSPLVDDGTDAPIDHGYPTRKWQPPARLNL